MMSARSGESAFTSKKRSPMIEIFASGSGGSSTSGWHPAAIAIAIDTSTRGAHRIVRMYAPPEGEVRPKLPADQRPSAPERSQSQQRARGGASGGSETARQLALSGRLFDEPLSLVVLVDLLLLIYLPVAVLLHERVELVLVGAELVQKLVLRAQDVRNLRAL